MFSEQLTHKAAELYNLAVIHNMVIATAESCTAGMVAALITTQPGSSKIFDRGFITYSNQSKNQLLGVEMGLIEEYGPVSKEVTCALAIGALRKSGANISVAVTGYASHASIGEFSQVGLVHIVVARPEYGYRHCQYDFIGDRHHIRECATENAIKLLIDVISGR